MINNRTDYRWVTIPDDMLINGEIMPLRQNKGSLRGEDVCFLLEAMSEIYKVVNNANTSNVMDKRILSERYRRVITQFRTWAQISPTQSGKPVKGGQWQKYYDLDSSTIVSPTYMDSSMAVGVEELQADVSAFQTGKPLNQQEVMKIFEDQMKMRFFQIYTGLQTNLMQNPTYNVVKTGKEEVHEDVAPPYTWNYATKISSSNGVETYSSEETTLNGGQFLYDPGNAYLKDLNFVKRAIVFVQFFLSVRRYDNSSLKRFHYNRCYPISAVLQDGKFVIDSKQVVDAVNEFIAQQNFNLNPTNRNNGVRSGYMQMDPEWAVVELGDRMNWKQEL